MYHSGANIDLYISTSPVINSFHCFSVDLHSFNRVLVVKIAIKRLTFYKTCVFEQA